MTKKHEELVEEIAKKAIEFYHPYPSSIPLESDRDFIRELITLILSAVDEGLEIPREETRMKDCYISELGGHRDVIVLSPEEIEVRGWPRPEGLMAEFERLRLEFAEQEEARERRAFVERFVRLGYEPVRKKATFWLATQRAPGQIRFVRKAIEEGSLPLYKVPPKLPGEVGRGPIIQRDGHTAILLPDGEWITIYEGSPCTFIAVAPREAMDLVEMIENLEAHLERLNEFLAREGIVPKGEEEKA